MIVRFCEFTGDDKHDFDEFGYKRRCEHIGFIPKTGQDICCLYKQPIGTSAEGWTTCCAQCTQPVQVKELP